MRDGWRGRGSGGSGPPRGLQAQPGIWMGRGRAEGRMPGRRVDGWVEAAFKRLCIVSGTEVRENGRGVGWWPGSVNRGASNAREKAGM